VIVLIESCSPPSLTQVEILNLIVLLSQRSTRLEFDFPRLQLYYVSLALHHRKNSKTVCVQAPFCVHPQTGKVCVPIEVASAGDFDPEKVPTIQKLTAKVIKLLM
jgi:DNA primase small subunit